MADAPLFYSILFDTHLALTGCGSSTVHARGPDGSDVTPMRTTGPCGPAGEPAVESHGWHFT